MAIALAFMSAVLYGVSDYVGGRASRRSPATAVALVAEVTVFALCIVIIPLIESDGPTSRAIWWGLAAGITSSIGVVGLYYALAKGNMTVVAPVTGLVAAIVPVAVGIATGDRPSPLAVAGIVAAVVAVALIGGIARMLSGESGGPGVDAGIVAIALGVGLSFGLLFVSLDRSGDDTGQWPLLFARFTSLPILVLAALVQFRGNRPPVGRQLVLPAAAVGILIACSNASYLISTREGLLSVVAVVVAMYPASTIVLASVIDGERATHSQVAGMALAAAALVMITTGS
ncbi:MAG TPA: EamA family transporter [Ilumatobacter sp.]|jgi:drug/metabolite transporter (DMT)-like permease|nr:EamA family transporter [Ilumatobacter sp.]